ncbi:hypothetical protein AB1Y20_017127 [Prymnesium parvum]|uniref:Peptidase C14 caspase domain-containing protein n=1 Tax=Prymnesium parvum TaxID=97485 RepID=A0AB34IBU0_PRYPA|mmetsp:Transcript_8093/g.20066  ORF Transcript_8093/g.20066 Transcript_8093/m.20066 type:complete len:380 (+) Transcript_8093:59-1198(+)
MGFFGSMTKLATKAVKEAVEEAVAPPPAASRDTPPSASGQTFAQQSEKAIPGVIRMFSGCQDAQTSADVFDTSVFQLPAECGPGGAGGACTNAMLKTLLRDEANPPTWVELLEGMRHILKEKKFTQLPQLSSSRQLQLNEPFSVVGGGGGKKRALLIGINYVGQQGELRGCHNDVLSMKQYIEKHGYSSDADSMKVLMDDGQHEMPTMANIISAFGWLTHGIEAGDSLFFHYSGHGGSVKDTNNDEADGKDETLIPVDYQEKGQLSDDVILANLVLEVPRDATLTAVIDACHSGTVLDLPYTLVADSSTMESVASGQTTALPENGEFNFAQLLKVGQLLFTMHQQGASKQEIAVAAFTELNKAGALKGLSGSFASLFNN